MKIIPVITFRVNPIIKKYFMGKRFKKLHPSIKQLLDENLRSILKQPKFIDNLLLEAHQCRVIYNEVYYRPHQNLAKYTANCDEALKTQLQQYLAAYRPDVKLSKLCDAICTIAVTNMLNQSQSPVLPIQIDTSNYQYLKSQPHAPSMTINQILKKQSHQGAS